MKEAKITISPLPDDLPEEILDIIRGLNAEGRSWRIMNAAQALAEGRPDTLPFFRRRYGDQTTIVFRSREGGRVIYVGHLVAHDEDQGTFEATC